MEANRRTVKQGEPEGEKRKPETFNQEHPATSNNQKPQLYIGQLKGTFLKMPGTGVLCSWSRLAAESFWRQLSPHGFSFCYSDGLVSVTYSAGFPGFRCPLSFTGLGTSLETLCTLTHSTLLFESKAIGLISRYAECRSR